MGQGHAGTSKGLLGVISRSKTHLGEAAVSGRYHRLPRRIEDDYELSTTVLGSGYNGQVHLAKRKTDGAKVAIKGFKLHGVGRDKKEELETELEVGLLMDHPHLARLVDVYESEDHLDLVMECMSGGELFQRVVELKTFSERNAADAANQMLLAIEYIHTQHVVHRDIKLENFMYESEKKVHLKLIDFGFSKIWKPNTKMRLSCGTLSYVAPEVLDRNYGSQCDIWSFGVTIYVLLFGYMPFSGSEDRQMSAIKSGKYAVRQAAWKRVGEQGQDFVRKLLVVDPKVRFTAQQALAHKWIAKRASLQEPHAEVTQEMASALAGFGSASYFRRACMSMMAWSLTAEERAQVRDAFLEMDTDKTGTISLVEFKRVLEDKYHMTDDAVMQAFSALDTTHDDEVHYSDFLAAMVSSRIALHDDLLKNTFARFDTDHTGEISKENLKEVLGPSCTDAEIQKILEETHETKDGKITYKAWIEYLQAEDAHDHHEEVAARVIDQAMDDNPNKELKQKRMHLKSTDATMLEGKNVDEQCQCTLQ